MPTFSTRRVEITALQVSVNGGGWGPIEGQNVQITSETSTVLRGVATPVDDAEHVLSMAVQCNNDDLAFFPPPLGHIVPYNDPPFQVNLPISSFTPPGQYRVTLHAWDDLGDHSEKSITFMAIV